MYFTLTGSKQRRFFFFRAVAVAPLFFLFLVFFSSSLVEGRESFCYIPPDLRI